MATPILIDGFRIDIAESEEHSFPNEVTEHPVEEGADIADHVRARPVTVTISGLVSNTPINITRPDGELPADAARVHLEGVRDRRQPVTIETSLRGYTDMVLENLSFPSSARTGGSLQFNATFKQVRLVTNDRATVPVAIPLAKKKSNKGNKPPLSAEELALRRKQIMHAMKKRYGLTHNPALARAGEKLIAQGVK